MNNDREKKVQAIIRYKFKDEKLLTRALTHNSYLLRISGSGMGDYQRLEFLGDALLEFIVTDEIYHEHPNYDEGMLTKLRADIVSKTPLAKAIEDAGIIEYAYCEGVMSSKMKSDLFESLTAAIYLDSKSLKPVKKFVMKMLGHIIHNKRFSDVVDYKSKLYEYCAARKMQVEFKCVDMSGSAHELSFNYELYLDKQLIAAATGKTKRAAQQKCAEIAFKEHLNQKNK